MRLSRRGLMRRFGAAAASVGAPRLLSGAGPKADAPRDGRKREPGRPNIVFVMLDDAGIGDFGCYGQKDIKTPVMDRMAAEGTRFTQCYVGSPVCAPCRCILMTGLHSGHCTRRDNRAKASPPGEGKDRGLVPLRAEDFTVAALLRKAGYVTGGFGKWGLGNPGTTGSPDKHGFDDFFGYLDQVHAHDYYTTWLWRNGETVPLPGNEGGKRQQYSHDVLAAAALEFIRKHRGRPFFLYLPFTPPHGKYEVPDDAPYTNESWPQQCRNYAAMISRADRDVGRVLALLKELALDESTVVFYTSDNGPNGPFIKQFHSAAGLRGGKRSLYEGGIRMPMVVRWPGKVPAGAVSDFAWTFADFLPTAAEIAGTQPPKGLDGMSVLPTLLGKPQKPHEALYWEFHAPFHQAVRMGRFKGVRFGTEAPLALYDLSADPAEKTDLAARHGDVVARMEAFLKTARTDTPYWPVTPQRPARKAKAAKKKAKGREGSDAGNSV